MIAQSSATQNLNLNFKMDIKTEKQAAPFPKIVVKTTCDTIKYEFSTWQLAYDPYYDTLLSHLKLKLQPMEPAAKEEIVANAETFLGNRASNEEYMTGMFLLFNMNIKDDIEFSFFMIRQDNAPLIKKLADAITNFENQQLVVKK